jgi:hypothetical protein
MKWPTEDAVSALLNDQPNLGAWLPTLGVMALAMTPLGMILAGIWGAVLTSGLFIFVWLASLVWVFARHGSLGSAKLLPSLVMVVAWPVIGVLFGIVR